MNSPIEYTPRGRTWSSRFYETESDLLKMQSLLMEARARTDDWRYAHVGELNFAYFMVVCHLDPKEHIRLWHDPQGGLVAYAILGEDPSFDCQVLPEYEWIGIETEALEWAERRIDQLRLQSPDTWGGNIVSGARQDDPKKIAFLEGHGFHYRGEFSEVNMLRSLDEPLPASQEPAGYQVRAMAEGCDISSRASAHREVWQPWSVGNISDDNYAAFMRLPGYQPELDVVSVTPDGTLAAYVNG
jgi:GNAT superfamily N-acetyltransferase